MESLRRLKCTDLSVEHGWDILPGTARFTIGDSGPALDVELTGGGRRTVRAGHYLIAMGSAPWAPPIQGLADAGYLTSATAMELGASPASMIVLGGNASQRI